MLRLRLIPCVALALALSLGGCSPTRDTQSAEDVITQFRENMDATSFAVIYDSAAPDWRKAISRNDSDAFLGAVSRKLGHVKTSVRTGWRDNLSSGGHVIVLSYHTEFNGGSGDETFTIRLDGAHGQLAGYHVNSMALILNDSGGTRT